MTADIYKCQLVCDKTVEYAESPIGDPDSVFELLCDLGLDKASDEYFYLICLDTQGDVVGVHEVAHGTLDLTPVHPREVFKRALANNAYGIIVAHNHPSGSIMPSDKDFETTKRLAKAGKLLGVPLLDHIIVGGGNYCSFKAMDEI